MKKSLRKTWLGFILLIAGTSVNYAQDNKNAFQRIAEVNSLGKPECITISKNDRDKTNKNIKQYKLAYNQKGELYSKEVLEWNTSENGWEKCARYIYEYNAKGEFAYQIVQKWNKENAVWNNHGYMIYDTENGFIAATK